jgi:hypothetical protein
MIVICSVRPRHKRRKMPCVPPGHDAIESAPVQYGLEKMPVDNGTIGYQCTMCNKVCERPYLLKRWRVSGTGSGGVNPRVVNRTGDPRFSAHFTRPCPHKFHRHLGTCNHTLESARSNAHSAQVLSVSNRG